MEESKIFDKDVQLYFRSRKYFHSEKYFYHRYSFYKAMLALYPTSTALNLTSVFQREEERYG